MRKTHLEDLIIKLVDEGADTLPKLTAALSQYEITTDINRKLAPHRVNQHDSVGSRIKGELTRLRHRRKLKLEGRQYVVIKRGTYQPPVSMEKLVEKHSKTIPKNVEAGILLL